MYSRLVLCAFICLQLLLLMENLLIFDFLCELGGTISLEGGGKIELPRPGAAISAY